MQKSQIRCLVDSDIDQLVESIGFEYDYIPEIKRGGLVLTDCYQNVKIVLFHNKHHITLFRILDASYADCSMNLFNVMFAGNSSRHFYCSIDEALTLEHNILKDLGFRCYQAKKKHYKFYLERVLA